MHVATVERTLGVRLFERSARGIAPTPAGLRYYKSCVEAVGRLDLDSRGLVLLTDVSMSVRATARFTLHLVYGMQSLFTQTRSFAFVDAPVEITELFAEHPLERALGLVFDGLPAGGLPV